jgi:acetyltransferase-like isoleucine patch superfamily enzyme
MTSDDIFIHPTAEVHTSARIGKASKIWNGAQVRECAVIGEKCNLGKDVYVDVDVTLGNRVRVQNGVSIYKGVHLEDDVFVGPHVCFTNDLYPRAFNHDWKLVETFVRRGASIGAGATIVCGVTIGEYALVGVAAVVTKDIPPYGLVMGNPARLKGYVCRCGRPLKIAPLDQKDTYICPHCNESMTLLAQKWSVR